MDETLCPARPLTHYVVVRSDLPLGFLAAQVVHAAGESSPGNIPEGTHAVVLSVPNEDALWDVHSDLIQSGPIPPGVRSGTWNGSHTLIVEPDAPRGREATWGSDGELTAIGIAPTKDRAAYAKALGRLPLLK